jgi:hypothetical protein
MEAEIWRKRITVVGIISLLIITVTGLFLLPRVNGNIRYFFAPVAIEKFESTGLAVGIKTTEGCGGFRVKSHFGDWTGDTFTYSYLCERLRTSGWLVPYLVLGDRPKTGDAVQISEYWVQWHAPRFVLFIIRKG